MPELKMGRAGVWSAIVLIGHLVSVPAHAEPLPGIRFDMMAEGCRIHGVYSTGEAVVDEYVGRKGKMHVVKTFDSRGRHVRTTTYNAMGYMTRKDWAGGKWETFSPYSCFSEPGPCTYVYRNADGARKRFVGQVNDKGGRRVSRGGFEGEAPFPDTVLTLGKYNTTARSDDGGLTYTETKLENCARPG